MRLYLIPILLFLPAGMCQKPEPVASDDALFCDIEEPRRFTQTQVDWRSVNDVANFRRDLQTNLAWDAEQCDTVAETEGA